MQKRDGDTIFETWAEIADYLGRAVSTVREWAQRYGLPVEKAGPCVGSGVIVSKRALDAWWGRFKRPLNGERPSSSARAHGDNHLLHKTG